MQVCQRLRIFEPGAFRHETFDELQDTISAIEKAAQNLAGVGAFAARATLVKQAFGARRVFGRRQEQERQKIARLEMSVLFLELRPAFGVDHRRGHVGKV